VLDRALIERDFGSRENTSYVAGHGAARQAQVGGEDRVRFARRVRTVFDEYLRRLLLEAGASGHLDGASSGEAQTSDLGGGATADLCDAGRMPGTASAKDVDNEEEEEEEVVFVTHGMVISAFLREYLGPAHQPVSTANTGVFTFRLSATGKPPAPLVLNGTEHLDKLKRQAGGIGRAKFDPAQKSIKTFFAKK
jgi:hypothetical protein